MHRKRTLHRWATLAGLVGLALLLAAPAAFAQASK